MVRCIRSIVSFGLSLILAWPTLPAEAKTPSLLTFPATPTCLGEQALVTRVINILDSYAPFQKASVFDLAGQRSSESGHQVFTHLLMASGIILGLYYPLIKTGQLPSQDLFMLWNIPGIVSAWAGWSLKGNDIAFTRHGVTDWLRGYLHVSPLTQSYVDIEEAVHRWTTARVPLLNEDPRWTQGWDRLKIRSLKFAEEGLAQSMALIVVLPFELWHRVTNVYRKHRWTWHLMRDIDYVSFFLLTYGFITLVISLVGLISPAVGVQDLPYLYSIPRSLASLGMAIAWVGFRVASQSLGRQNSHLHEGRTILAVIRQEPSSALALRSLPPRAQELARALELVHQAAFHTSRTRLRDAVEKLKQWEKNTENLRWLDGRSLLGALPYGTYRRLERWAKVDNEISGDIDQLMQQLRRNPPAFIPRLAPAHYSSEQLRQAA